MTSRIAWGWLYLAGFVSLVIVAQLGLLPHWVAPLTRNGVDKVLHFLLFGGIGFVVGRWTAEHRPQHRRHIWIALLLLCALDEIAQIWIPHRSADALDLAADAAGISSLYWLALRIRRSALRVERP